MKIQAASGTYDWLKKWALYTPDKLFLREHRTGNEFTFLAMHYRVEKLASLLQKKYDVRVGERIALFSKNNMFFVELYLACIRIGAILVPLNFRLTLAELDGLLQDAAPKIILVQDELSETLSKSMYQGSLQKHTNEIIAESEVQHESAEQVPTIDEHTVTMILYTAGTTGIPKGVMITHRMLLNNAINTVVRLDITSLDHTQSYAPFFHTGGWNVLFTPFLFHGASHTIMEKFDVGTVLTLIETEKTTILFGVPTMLQMIAEHSNFHKTDFSSIRYAIVGGAPMPLPLIELWHKKGVPIRQGYGLTEVGPNCFSLPEADAIRKRGSIGLPNFSIEPKLVNDAGELCADEEPGELLLKSPVVTPGYWNKAEETTAAKDGEYFRTGDIAKRDSEGYYYIVDRKKNMFISGGENVYPAEIERVIYRLTEVREAAVIGVRDDRWGEVGKAIIAVHRTGALTAEEVFAHCRAQLAKYKIPKYVEFIEELPKTDAGKINKQLLQNLYGK